MAKITEQVSDEQLLRQMLAGDAGAFETLYDRRQGAIYRFALRMSGSSALAEDVTHDVFLALMRDDHQFDPARGALASYLFGIARNRVLRRLGRERAFVSISDETEDDQSSVDLKMVSADDPLIDLTRSETIEMVRQAILVLPPHYREVVVLCNLQEMSYEQAANIMNCPVGTVRSRLNRARAMLVEKLRVLQNTDRPEYSSSYLKAAPNV